MEKLIIGLVLLGFSASTYANGGGPLLLIVNFMLFTYGQVWILSIETFLFQKVFRGAKFSVILKWVFLGNLASTLVGALLAPLVWAAIFGFLGNSLWDSEVGKILFALGTWIAGDNSPHPNLAMAASVVGFVVAYFITVYIERRVFIRATNKGELPATEELLKYCYGVNAVSYAGLIGLFVYYAKW